MVNRKFRDKGPFFLRHARVNANRWKVTLHKQLVQLSSSSDTFDEDNNLIEVQCIQQIIQLPVLLQLTQFDVVLLFAIPINDLLQLQKINEDYIVYVQTCTRP